MGTVLPPLATNTFFAGRCLSDPESDAPGPILNSGEVRGPLRHLQPLALHHGGSCREQCYTVVLQPSEGNTRRRCHRGGHHIMRRVQSRRGTTGDGGQGRQGGYLPAGRSVEEQSSKKRGIQRLLYLPEPRARVRLPEEFRNRGKDKQDQVAQAEEPGS